jgi:hypothetical protein
VSQLRLNPPVSTASSPKELISLTLRDVWARRSAPGALPEKVNARHALFP